MPVEGPALWASTMTTGVSDIPARPSASDIRQMPAPEVPVAARVPMYDAPIAMWSAAISSSACSTAIPAAGPCSASVFIIEVDGVIG